MPSFPSIAALAHAAAGAGVGYVIGLMYFQQLHRSVERLPTTRRGAGVIALLTGAVVRIAGALAAFAALTAWSPAAAIGGLAGFALSRKRALTKLGSS